MKFGEIVKGTLASKGSHSHNRKMNSEEYVYADSGCFEYPLLNESTSSDNDDNVARADITIPRTTTPQNNYALTTFLLLNTMIGSGILNQPFVFESSGVFGGLLGFVFASILTWIGLILLTDAGDKVNLLEYSALAKYAFGHAGEVMIDVSIIIVTFGSQLGYILIVGDTFTNLVQSWGCPAPICTRNIITSLSVIFLVTPLCLFRHFGHLAWLSIFSIITIVSVLMLVTIGGPLEEKRGPVTLFNATGMLRSVGSIVFSLNCSSANFQVTSSAPVRLPFLLNISVE